MAVYMNNSIRLVRNRGDDAARGLRFAKQRYRQ